MNDDTGKAAVAGLPYTVHFGVGDDPEVDTDSFSFTRQGVLLNGEVQAPIDAESIRELRATIFRILGEALSHDYVATFALGGVFPLNLMSLCTLDGQSLVTPDKFHLLPGLNWQVRTFDQARRFRDWLDGLPDGSSVLIFDTGNDGSAGGAIRNLIEKHYRDAPQRDLLVSIRVIATRRGREDKRAEEFTGPNGKFAVVDLRFYWVDSNPFEDAVYYIGYASLRTLGIMKEREFFGGLAVRFADGRQNVIIGPGVANQFMRLFIDRLDFLEHLNR